MDADGLTQDTLELPADYYDRIFEVEQRHWWHRGMLRLSAALLGARLDRRDQAILDAGCGTGGFLHWALGLESFTTASGVDVSAEAIALARRRVPEADLQVSPVSSLPFADCSFDLVSMNDVLQHVPETDVQASLSEIRRVLRPDGALLLRTGGALRARRERPDWRIYDRSALRASLAAAGLAPQRLTHVNLGPSLAATARGNAPRAPSESRHGIPALPAGPSAAVGDALMRTEAALIHRTRANIPYGHTIMCVAVPAPKEGPWA